MPKPDQKVTISAALQRPQRHKALPKPIAQNLESVLQPIPETLALEKAEIQELASPVLEESTASDQIPTQISDQASNKIKDSVKSTTESPTKSTFAKPKLKPKLKTDTSEQVVLNIEPQIDSEAKVDLNNAQSSDLPSDLLTSLPLTNNADSPLNSTNAEVIEEPIEIQNLELEQLADPDHLDEQINLDPNSELNPTAIAQQHQDHKQDHKAQEESLPIFWCQAVGLVAGKYVPSAEAFYKGELIITNGSAYKAYVLSKAIKALEKKIDLSLEHQFVVYPKTSKIHGLRLEILATDVSSKIEEFEDGQFNIRGFITKKLEKQLENSFLVEIQRRPEYLQPSQNDRFTLNVKGDIPLELVQQFVYLKCQLIGDDLKVIDYEHLACPVVTKRLTTVEKPILKPKVPKPELD
ncbi:hypothetical protein Syn7502_01597 [Synechococcus sp. PCC 7502]|uniref:hypothetical protein n=1 Tax=Synechococcus sp. PCC 7502 TaxID=1173263 RepID=UPI00029F961B|nr:hypothetical protein [Synechococcus sp. PCC 7502]AFY73657.1 hypothetical protein Syn7502_01597 [Synechococcus sp. PCC 7502]